MPVRTPTTPLPPLREVIAAHGLQASKALDREFDLRGTPVADFDGYTTVDLLTRIKLPVGTLSVGVENLFSEQYVTYYSQSTPRNDTYTAGRGRVLTVGWSHRF